MSKETYQKVSDVLLEAELLTEGLDMGTAQRIISKLQEFDGLTPRQLIPKINKIGMILRPAVPAFSKLPKLQMTFNLRFRTFVKQEFNMNITAFENSRIRVEQLLRERGLLPKRHAYNFSRFFTLWIAHKMKKANPEVPLGSANIVKEARMEIRSVARMVKARKMTGEEFGDLIKDRLSPKMKVKLVMTAILWLCLMFLLLVLAPKIGLKSPKGIAGVSLVFLLVSIFIVFVMLKSVVDELIPDKKKPKEEPETPEA